VGIRDALFIVAFFVAAWVISRAAGLLAGFLQILAIRRGGGDPGAAERVFQRKQRETAISLVETSVRYVAFGAALAAAIVVIVGSRRIGAIAGASFVAVVLAFAVQRLLIDILQGLFMFFEGWFAVGDTIVVEPWDVEGIVERVSLRATTLRSVDGDLLHVHNSQILAVRVIPKGLREFEVELYATSLEEAERLVQRVSRVVPQGPTHFVRAPELRETEALDEGLFRLTATTAVPPGREWLAQDLLPSLLRERASDGLIVHGPVVVPTDEQAARRFARIVQVRETARRPRMSLVPRAARSVGRRRNRA
jgi:hypothetical protein